MNIFSYIQVGFKKKLVIQVDFMMLVFCPIKAYSKPLKSFLILA